MELKWNQEEINFVEFHCSMKDRLEEAAVEVLNRMGPEGDDDDQGT